MSLFADDIILYIKNPKDSTKKLLELIDEFNKVIGYKINIQIVIAFLCTNNELSEREKKYLKECSILSPAPTHSRLSTAAPSVHTNL